MRHRPGIGAIVVVAATLVAVGCGESTQDAEQALCADLATLRASAAALEDVTPDTSVDDFEQARQNVAEAWAEVKASGDNLGDDRFDDVEEAWDDVADSVDDVDDADSLEQARSEIADQLVGFEDAARELGSGIDCTTDDA